MMEALLTKMEEEDQLKEDNNIYENFNKFNKVYQEHKSK